MVPEKGDGHYFGSDGRTYLGTDGKNDNKSYTLKGGLKPNLNNKSVNWGGKLDVKHTEKLRSNSTESVFDTSKVDNALTSTIKRTGNGGCDPSRVDGAIINSLKYDLPQGLQDTGDTASLVGYGMTITGVGAGIGVPVAGIGNGVSLAGSAIEFGVDLCDGNMREVGINLGFYIGGKLVEKGLNKVLPGAGKKFGEDGFNLGTEILTQGASLKVSGTQKIVSEKLKE